MKKKFSLPYQFESKKKKIYKFLGDKHPAQAIVYFYLNELL